MDYPFEVLWFWKTIRISKFKFKIPWFWIDVYLLSPFYWAIDSSPVCSETDYYPEDYYAYYEDDYYDYYYCDRENDVEDNQFYEDEEIGNLLFSLPGEIDDLLFMDFIRRKDGYTTLASNCVLIVDIDCDDNIETPLSILQNYIDCSGDNFFVYKTKNGMRYIQANTIYQGVNQSAISLLKTLGSDPQYIDFCVKGGYFMARVTPKLDKEERDKYLVSIVQEKLDLIPYKICSSLGCFHRGRGIYNVDKSIMDFITLHDYACKANVKNLPLM